jgi:hypothetical protein
MIKYVTLFFLLVSHLVGWGQCMNTITTITSATPVSPTSVALTLVQAIPNPDVSTFTRVFSVTYTTGYQYSIAGSGVWANAFPTSSTSVTVSGLTPGTHYEFRGYTNSSCTEELFHPITREITSTTNWGPFYSPSSPVSALTFAATPTLAGASSGNSTSVTFSWNAVAGVVNGYYLDFSASSTFSSYIFQNVQVSSATTSFNTTSAGVTLTPGTNYYYQVRAYNASGVSDYSLVSSAIVTRPAAAVATSATDITTTSFKANWTAPTGIVTSYRLDVSANNFATNLAGYNDLLVNGTSQTVTGLAAGTTYSYRVRAVNASGPSVNSNNMSVVTRPAAPVATDATGSTINSFVANWQTVTGATSYLLDVSVDGFVTFVAGYNSLSVSSLFQSVVGLSAGTSYSYRVRAINASGTSIDSNIKTGKTLSIAPVAQSASGIEANKFTANWAAAFGAESYQIDVATDAAFTTILVGYNNKALPLGTSTDVLGVQPGTTYHYRIRAVNTGGVSASSSAVSLLTLPNAPQSFVTQNPQSESIKLSWQQVQSATSYELEVSTSDNFIPLVNGYSPKVISPGTTINYVAAGLTPNTLYYFRLRTRNAQGLSAYSTIQSEKTSSSSGVGISLSLAQKPDTQLPGQSQKVSLRVSGGNAATPVYFFHKKNTETAYTREITSLAGGVYEVALSDAWFDKFGMLYYFETLDQINNRVTIEGSIASAVSNVLIPIESFGKEIKNYQIISFPYALGKARVEDLMVSVMKSGYNKTQWRFLQYQNGVNVDFLNGLSISDIAQGQGYWFISKSPVELSFGEGKSHGNSVDRPFVIRLKKGWNQIGNPFPYNLSWQDVRSANPTVDIGSLYLYDKANVSFAEGDALNIFSGGFVLAENDTDLIFPVTLPNKGGRRATGVSEERAEGWNLPIEISQGEVTNTLSGIGMRVGAQEGKDKFDKVTLPRFLRFVEFNSKQPSYEYNLSTDVVPLQDTYRWNFDLESNSSEAIDLRWNNQAVSSSNGQIILYDRTKQVVVNMAKMNSYQTQTGASISIHYNKLSTSDFDKMELGIAYPNPFSASITIPYMFTTQSSLTKVEMSVYDLTGRLLLEKLFYPANQQEGIQSIVWDGTTNLGTPIESGAYIYKVLLSDNNQVTVFKGKIIKK